MEGGVRMAFIPQSIPSVTDERSITGQSFTVYVFTFHGLRDVSKSVIRVVGPSSVNVNELWNNRQVSDETVAQFLEALYQAGFVGVTGVQVISFNG